MVVFGLRLNKARETIQYGCIWFTIEQGAGDDMVVFG